MCYALQHCLNKFYFYRLFKNIIVFLFNIQDEPTNILQPIAGYEREPLLSLEEACNPLYSLIDDLPIQLKVLFGVVFEEIYHLNIPQTMNKHGGH
jgi:hypothetical protein